MKSKNVVFNFFLISFLLWIFLNNIILSAHLSFIVVWFFILLFLNFYIYNKKFKIIFLFIFLWTILWISISAEYNKNLDYRQGFISDYYDGSRHTVYFEIDSVYNVWEYSSQYIAKLTKVDNVDIVDKLDTSRQILSIITVANNFKFKKADHIKTDTKLEKIRNFSEFDYEKYMLSRNIFFKCFVSNPENIGRWDITKIEDYIISFREKSLTIIKKLYPKKEAVFLAGILLWAREDLDPDLKQAFNNSGLTHFIAVSGFNITILIIAFSYIFKYFPSIIRVVIISVLIVLFVILVWDTAPVIRASITGLLAYYVLSVWRQWNIFTIVLLSAFLMSLFSPLSLNYDVSFALSFLAVLWIVFLHDFFEKTFHFLPETLAIREAFVMTMSALSFTVPIMMFNFGQVSIIAPLSNIAVTWTIPISMLLWFFSLVAYHIMPVFWYVFWFLNYQLLHYDMIMVAFFWNLEFSVFKYDFWVYKNILEISYFMILAFVILYFRGEKK